ncbi:hypothetical protein KGQ20_44325, partial [Catenulispora sp. NF23]|uniref:hypothetical protein n=1 Tax=Catenulispora pinistramenti TaxID=2705254 RepID=UPI001BA6DD47
CSITDVADATDVKNDAARRTPSRSPGVGSKTRPSGDQSNGRDMAPPVSLLDDQNSDRGGITGHFTGVNHRITRENHDRQADGRKVCAED